MSSSRRHYFILDVPCPAKEIPRMMCRVVANETDPLLKCAPVEDIKKSGIYPHNTNDILPHILPAPVRTLNRRELVALAPHHDWRLKLGSLLGIGSTVKRERRAELEAKEVNCYALSNPEEVYKVLKQQNKYYERDVLALLESLKGKLHSGKGWLVTGFLTTSKEGAFWTRSDSVEKGVGMAVTVPILEAVAGVPMPLDPGFSMGGGVGRTSVTEMFSPDEVIFAVAYSKVKLHRRFQGGKFVWVDEVGEPKKPNRHDLTFGNDGGADESDEESSSDEEASPEDGSDITETRLHEEMDGQKAAAAEAGKS